MRSAHRQGPGVAKTELTAWEGSNCQNDIGPKGCASSAFWQVPTCAITPRGLQLQLALEVQRWWLVTKKCRLNSKTGLVFASFAAQFTLKRYFFMPADVHPSWNLL